MKKVIRILCLAALIAAVLAVAVSCGGETDSIHKHVFEEDWVLEREADYENEGLRSRVCSECGEKQLDFIPRLKATYTLTVVDGLSGEKSEIKTNGNYFLTAPRAHIGYAFADYVTEDGEKFSRSGSISEDVTIYAVYEILPTETFAQLKERIEAGADILLAADILLTDTVYVPYDVIVTAEADVTLTRDKDFLGDLFILGSYPDGTSTILRGETARLTLKPEEGVKIVFDGNKSLVSGDVKGTVFFLENSATLNMYDGVEIINCKKTGNDYLLRDDHNMSSPNLAGGSAVIITSGVFNMYGGAIRNCEVDMDDSATTPEDEQTEGYNDSSRGGAVFNYGTFNMYGGIVENCSAGRGGAFYNYRIMYLVGGQVSGNHTSSYGGVFYNPDSQYVYAVIGSKGTDINMTFSGNTSGKSGGVMYIAHQSTVYVMGSTLFEGNRAISGNGGVINAAGAVVVDYAIFEGNRASSKGGAIYAYYNSPENTVRIIELKGGIFRENEAPRGGALGFSNGDDTSVGAKANIGEVVFENNKAPLSSSGKYGYGGAIHIDQTSTVSIYGNAIFTGNVSADNGGAIYVTKTSILNVNAKSGVRVVFESNASEGGNGGAVYDSGSKITFNAIGGEILFKTNESKSAKGGAIAVHSKGELKLYGVVFSGNKADENGGALYVYGGSAVIGDSSNTSPTVFTENAAAKGGAIYLSSTSSAASAISAHEIIANNNTATGGGGAIYVVDEDEKGATLSVKLLTANENEAGGNGGALYIYDFAEVNIGTLNANGNTAASGKYGGVAYVSGKSNAYIETLNAKGNKASSGGCIYLTTSGTTLTIAGGDIRENSADSDAEGNAVWVNSKSSVLKLKTDASDNILLLYTEGEILGKSGFKITKYKEAA